LRSTKAIAASAAAMTSAAPIDVHRPSIMAAASARIGGTLIQSSTQENSQRNTWALTIWAPELPRSPFQPRAATMTVTTSSRIRNGRIVFNLAGA
jgi:hypothetical protein